MIRRSAGRPLISDREAERRGFRGPAAARRRQVLRETLRAFDEADPPNRYHCQAQENLRRWRSQSPDPAAGPLDMRVLPGDWGEVTLRFTRSFGRCFAVLNMANAYVPGGGYVEGAVAQEENIFRRTDCHFHVGPDEYDAERDRYREPMTDLLSGQEGSVYLDTDAPRVCIRGPEDRTADDLGYPWLSDEEVFPFFELRAAAQDLRGGGKFDPVDARRRIAAQLDTLRGGGVRHAVLGASGCGAFGNPAREVARIYGEEIRSRSADFDALVFAIFDAGYGPGNYEPFRDVLGGE